MERTMPDGTIQQPSYPTVDFVVSAIANWVNKYRSTHAMHDEFGECSPEEVMQIAADMGVPAGELRALAAKGPDSARLLEKLLIKLYVDPVQLAHTNPAVMRDLQRLCVVCGHKDRCQHELREDTAAEHYREYCPNAFTLDALFKEKAEPPQH
jgi:hypothetical protein